MEEIVAGWCGGPKVGGRLAKGWLKAGERLRVLQFGDSWWKERQQREADAVEDR